MSGSIFLHGGGCSVASIQSCICAFVRQKKVVTVLFDRHPGEMLAVIKKTWQRYSKGKIIRFIIPKAKRLAAADLKWLSESDAIFINGGDTRLYYQVYVRGPARRIIMARFHQGANVGGSSAGALILPQKCIVDGNRVARKRCSFTLCSSAANTGAKGARRPLQTALGIGVLRSHVLEVHGSEWGRLPRLMEAMKQLKMRQGIMIDENTCLTLPCGSLSRVKIRGEGRLYFVKSVGQRYVVHTKPS